MSTRLRTVLFCVVVPLLLATCKKLEDGTHVAPVTLYEKLAGNWMLTDLKQVDETAKSAGLKPDELSLYDQFGFGTFRLVLEVDDAHQPTAYRVEGEAAELFAKSGFWDLDWPFPQADGTPPTIRLYADAGKATPVGQLRVVSMPGATPQMELKLTRSSGGVPFVSYHYQLANSNP